MLKMILLAGTMTIAGPVLAQTTAPVGQTAPATAPTTTRDSAMPETGTPAVDPAATTAAPVSGTDAQAAATTTTVAPAQPSQTQVAQVVDQQFATYDKDGNGALSKAEFAAWMTALKASAPGAKASTPAEETAWNDAAFMQADGDKSATVTKTELTGFLVKGSSGAS